MKRTLLKDIDLRGHPGFEQATYYPIMHDATVPPVGAFRTPINMDATGPFGDGWKELAFDDVKGVAFVRVVVTKYWGIGGGLNKVQVYGK